MKSHEDIIFEKLMPDSDGFGSTYSFSDVLKAMNLSAEQALKAAIRWSLEGDFNGVMTVDKETFNDYLKEINNEGK